MKRINFNLIILGLGALFMVVMSSCHKDDEEQRPLTDPLITFEEVWDLIEEDSSDGFFDEDETTDFFIDFMKDGDFQLYHSESIDRYKSLIFIDRPENRGYWVLSGRMLTMYYDDGFREEWSVYKKDGILELSLHNTELGEYMVRKFEKLSGVYSVTRQLSK